MNQTLTVSVPIPDTHVLVSIDEYEELLSYSLDPVWDLKELKRNSKCHLTTLLKIDYYSIQNSKSYLNNKVSHIIQMKV